MIPLDQRSTLFPYTTLFRSRGAGAGGRGPRAFRDGRRGEPRGGEGAGRSAVRGAAGVWKRDAGKGNEPRDVADRKSTRLNSSHTVISYAVFCLKKKNKKKGNTVFAVNARISYIRTTVAERAEIAVSAVSSLVVAIARNDEPPAYAEELRPISAD